MKILNNPSQVSFEQSDTGYVLTIPAGTEIKDPIQVSANEASEHFTIKIGANARATIIENIEGADLNYQMKVEADKDSYIRVITLQNADKAAEIQELRETHAQSGAEVHLVNIHLGGSKVHTKLIQNGDGESPTLNTDFIGSARGDQEIVCDVKNHFHQKNGGGEINAKGVARDKSKLTINGVIAIDQAGGGTNTYMHEHALLLSKAASVSATPGLEIDTNDVKASHGASVSNLSDDAIFYAESRGIAEEEARSMLAKGFLSDRLSVIKDLPELYERVTDLI